MTTESHDDHQPGSPLGLGSSEGLGLCPERAAFDAWFAAGTFETMGDDWRWSAWQAGAAAERERCLYWCSMGDREGYTTHHIQAGTPIPRA